VVQLGVHAARTTLRMKAVTPSEAKFTPASCPVNSKTTLNAKGLPPNTEVGLHFVTARGNRMTPSGWNLDSVPLANAMTKADGTAWFGAAPPDLSVESRIRGRDWLYNYLIGFYRDNKSVSGWNNIVFPNVGMPHVLWELSGVNKLVETEYEDHEKATAAAIAVKGLSALEPLPGGKYAVLQIAPDVPGTMSRVQYEAFVADLVNYMDYMAEPVRNKRIHLGIIVLMFLGVLFFFAYWMKREYWKDLH